MREHDEHHCRHGQGGEGHWGKHPGHSHHHHGGECCGRHGGPRHHGEECGADREPRPCGPGAPFRRHFFTREEQIAWLEQYLKELQAEAKGVEERIAALQAGE